MNTDHAITNGKKWNKSDYLQANNRLRISAIYESFDFTECILRVREIWVNGVAENLVLRKLLDIQTAKISQNPIWQLEKKARSCY